jgi:uncharacterized protein YutE (UPF0331/DUF86 family)
VTKDQISEKVVTGRLGWIEEMLAGIAALPLENEMVFTQDPRNVAAAESYLRRALEALLDLGRHLLAKGFGLVVMEYKEIPQGLEQVGIPTSDEARLMREMAGYRNRMVHFYAEISMTELYRICAEQVKDVTRLANRLAQWVEKHPERVDRSL